MVVGMHLDAERMPPKYRRQPSWPSDNISLGSTPDGGTESLPPTTDEGSSIDGDVLEPEEGDTPVQVPVCIPEYNDQYGFYFEIDGT